MGLMQTTVLVNNRRPQSDTKLEVDVLEDIVLFLGRMPVVQVQSDRIILRNSSSFRRGIGSRDQVVQRVPTSPVLHAKRMSYPH